MTKEEAMEALKEFAESKYSCDRDPVSVQEELKEIYEALKKEDNHGNP